MMCLISCASLQVDCQQDKALQGFHSEYGYIFKPCLNETTPPTILGVAVTPSFLKVGDTGAVITANVYDPAGATMVYALVGNRMNLMLDLERTNQYTGCCGSTLPPGTYRVTIAAIDKSGNAAQGRC
jgi:hypothetical protein